MLGKKDMNRYRTIGAFWRAKALGLVGCLFSLFAFQPIEDIADPNVIESEIQVRVGVIFLCLGAGLYFILSEGLSPQQYVAGKLEGMQRWINLAAWFVSVPFVVFGGWLLIRNGVT